MKREKDSVIQYSSNKYLNTLGILDTVLDTSELVVNKKVKALALVELIF